MSQRYPATLERQRSGNCPFTVLCPRRFGWGRKSELILLYDEKNQGTKSVGIMTMSEDDREGFPGSAVVKNPPANAGDTGLSPGLGRSHMPRSN